jgi:hypothetical protein
MCYGSQIQTFSPTKHPLTSQAVPARYHKLELSRAGSIAKQILKVERWCNSINDAARLPHHLVFLLICWEENERGFGEPSRAAQDGRADGLSRQWISSGGNSVWRRRRRVASSFIWSDMHGRLNLEAMVRTYGGQVKFVRDTGIMSRLNLEAAMHGACPSSLNPSAWRTWPCRQMRYLLAVAVRCCCSMN